MSQNTEIATQEVIEYGSDDDELISDDKEYQIQIDNYMFKLIEQTDSILNYETIRIQSWNIERPHDIYDFWCYRSHSELGLWRFGAINPAKYGEYYKGPDKVQHTLIHLILQNYINKNKQHILFITINSINAAEHNLSYIPRIDKNGKKYNEITFNNIVDTKYETILMSNRKLIIPDTPFQKINVAIWCGHKNFKDIIKTITDFSTEFEKLYHIVDDKVIIPNYNYNFENIFIVNGNIYEMTLVNKITNDSILLYYLKSHFTYIDNNEKNPHVNNITKICQKKSHIMPFLLVPNNTINILGVLKQYISAGIFTCKEIDYSMSCKNNENRKYRITPKYTYIGYRYDNIFPFFNNYDDEEEEDAEEDKSSEFKQTKEHESGKRKREGKGFSIRREKIKKRTRREKIKKEKSKKRTRREKIKSKNKNKTRRYGVRIM